VYEDLAKVDVPDDYVVDPVVRQITQLVEEAQQMSERFSRGPRSKGPLPELPADALWRYSLWYTQALKLVADLAPHRRDEFERLYEPQEEILGTLTYGVVHFLNGVSATRDDGQPCFDHVASFRMAIGRQAAVLMGAIAGVYSPEGKAASTDELTEADRLLRLGSLRAAGCVAGVALERHVRTLAAGREPPIDPAATCARLNDKLKAAGAYDQITWRLVQALLDTRNKCAHPEDAAPTEGEVRLLVVETRRFVDRGP
jgi:hypothetical protein